MNIIKNVIDIGIEKPFTFLHMTDTHITRTDISDTKERKAFAKDRRDTYFSEADEIFEFALGYVKKTGFQLVHTGDFIDFVTPENLRAVKRFADETDMLMVAGNHEIGNCVNNVFCEKDFTEDLKIKEETLDRVQKFFNNDIRFFEKEINGVTLVGIDNSDYQIRPEAFDALKKIVSYGKPVILFMHIPLSTPHFDEKFGVDLLSMPDRIVDKLGPWKIFETKANADTVKAHDYIVNQPLIKAVISGHWHCNYETPVESEIKQFLTDINTLREITVK